MAEYEAREAVNAALTRRRKNRAAPEAAVVGHNSRTDEHAGLPAYKPDPEASVPYYVLGMRPLEILGLKNKYRKQMGGAVSMRSTCTFWAATGQTSGK